MAHQVALRNYFIYLPDHRTRDPWDCVATSAGFTKVLPGSPYPPVRHPVDHHFSWASGRVLQAYQIIYVTAGRGYFESEATTGRSRIERGSIVLLFPGIRHRYAPDSKTGWVEHWIECRGSCFDRAKEKGLIKPERPVLRVGISPDLMNCFQRCHALAQRRGSNNQAMLSTLGLHILSVLQSAVKSRGNFARRIDEIIFEAQSLIEGTYQETLSMEQLARQLHVGYSYFRQAFKARTGLSPKQYQLQIRLQKAQELLLNTSKSVKEIAEILGFDSAYHLSNQFKKHLDLAPRIWKVKSFSVDQPGVI
jgi:AraC-like DNA-binding protein